MRYIKECGLYFYTNYTVLSVVLYKLTKYVNGSPISR